MRTLYRTGRSRWPSPNGRPMTEKILAVTPERGFAGEGIGGGDLDGVAPPRSSSVRSKPRSQASSSASRRSAKGGGLGL